MRDPSILYSFLLVGLIFAFVGAVMARDKGVRILTGSALGFFFGPLGFLGVALMSEAKRKRTLTKDIEGDPQQTVESNVIERLKAWCTAVMLGLFGPLVLGYYVSQLIRGEFASKNGVVSRVGDPSSFYVISVFFGAIALFLTAISLLFLFFFVRGRRST